MKNTLLPLTLAAALGAASVSHAGDSVDYPDGYRSWTHIKTMVLHKGHPLENPFMGIHHVYGNEQGVKGTKTDHYEDGSILVFDLLKYMTADHASTEGDRVLVGVMVKDSNKYQSTGGWGFEGFAGNSHTKRLVNDGGKSCFDCHASQQENDYVFTRWRE